MSGKSAMGFVFALSLAFCLHFYFIFFFVFWPGGNVSFISAFVSAWETLFGPMVLISEKYPTKDGSQLFTDLGLCGLSSYRSTVRMSDIY